MEDRIRSWWKTVKDVASRDGFFVIGNSDDNLRFLIHPDGEPIFRDGAVFFPCSLKRYRHRERGYMAMSLESVALDVNGGKCGEDLDGLNYHELIDLWSFYSDDEYSEYEG
ncbi:hypothetical protein MCHI_001413 [Candidatus Magnetoovum chiemensis]|nr:hypothetical protein MCHI_001413 [Candidatus Magnetoovum chiemensis]